MFHKYFVYLPLQYACAHVYHLKLLHRHFLYLKYHVFMKNPRVIRLVYTTTDTFVDHEAIASNLLRKKMNYNEQNK